MDMDFSGKTAVVCGSTRGIGRAVAMEFARLGANVVLLARNEAQLNNVIREMHQSPRQDHKYLVVDFNDTAYLQNKLQDFMNDEPSVDILVNNTGGPPGGPLLDARPDAFRQAFENHLVCNQILVQTFAPQMKKQASGRIINIISTSVKEPIPGLGVSNTIRGAVANWAKTMAMELTPYGITVNNVLPGPTDTQRLNDLLSDKARQEQRDFEVVKQETIDQTLIKRLIEPGEVAAAVVYLASASAAAVSGINIPVDGGKTKSL